MNTLPPASARWVRTYEKKCTKTRTLDNRSHAPPPSESQIAAYYYSSVYGPLPDARVRSSVASHLQPASDVLEIEVFPLRP